MKSYSENLKRELEIIVQLSEYDREDTLLLSQLKNNFKNIIRYCEEQPDCVKADNDILGFEFFNSMKAVRLQTQYFIANECIFKPTFLWLYNNKMANTFIGFDELKESYIFKKIPTLLVNEFYHILSILDDVYIKEALSKVHCNSIAIQTQELYCCIKNEDYKTFCIVLNNSNADISEAAKYVRLIHLITVLFPQFCNLSKMETCTIDILESKVNELDEIFYMNKYIREFQDNVSNEKNFNQLEMYVAYLLAAIRQIYDLCLQFGLFKIEFKEKNCELLSLCYENTLPVDIEEEFDDIYMLNKIFMLQNDCCPSNLELTHDKQLNYPKESPENFPLCLYDRKVMCLDESFDVIYDAFLKNNISGNVNKENVKYVFFGTGIKPSAKLIWKGDKKELALFMSYLCKIVKKEVWNYLNEFITTRSSKEILFDPATNNSSNAKREEKKEFEKMILKMFHKKYKDGIPDNIRQDIR